MSTRVVDRVDDWDQQSVADGYAGLHRLADAGFSGVVRAGAAELYMTNGAVVGVEGGTIEDFEGASGTACRSPSPALPLLAVMQLRSDEVRAKYYTEETAISEVDRTLSGGGFTGYVDLSENVLSGDYYLVYHGGESMSVAFVGANGRLIDGDEAFESADGEVGIYEVRPVEVDAAEIPDPEPASEPDPTPAPDADADPGVDEVDGVDEVSTPAGAGGPDTDRESEPETGAGRAPGQDGAANGSEPNGDTEPEPSPGSDPDGATAADDGGVTEPAAESARAQQRPERAGAGATEEDTGARAESRPAEDRPGGGRRGAVGREAGADARAGEPDVALETRSIPSLDPARTTGSNDETRADVGPEPAPTSGAETEADRNGGQSRSRDPDPAPTQSEVEAGDDDGRAETDEQPAARAEEVERLESELAEATERAEDLEAELAEVREERDELRAEVERLKGELEGLEAEFGAAAEAEQRFSPAEALAGTDVFVRYRSKSEPTLESARDGNVTQEKVTDNLRLEKHTQFDAGGVAVGGQAYEAFLEDRLEFGFVRWVVEHLLFEIRDTGHTDALADLYGALPEIDRAELDGTIAVRYTEDGQEQRGQESFDVVLRDRMGNPLMVANLNDSREAATEGMMEGLVTAAERVGASKDTFVGAFLVTESFFEPEALETASGATRSGILSRDKRRSFVNISRKRGFHLCLVEARNKNVHLTVPEL